MEPEIFNVVATADHRQRVDLIEVSKLPCTIYDQEIYGGRVAYLKSPEMNGKVTIFPSGKLISVGTRSPSQAEEDLITAHDILAQIRLIEPTKIEMNIRNLVAVLCIGKTLDIEALSTQLSVIYEPEQFPGAILRTTQPKGTYIIFASGKIVIPGNRSMRDLHEAVVAIKKILKC